MTGIHDFKQLDANRRELERREAVDAQERRHKKATEALEASGLTRAKLSAFKDDVLAVCRKHSIDLTTNYDGDLLAIRADPADSDFGSWVRRSRWATDEES